MATRKVSRKVSRKSSRTARKFPTPRKSPKKPSDELLVVAEFKKDLKLQRQRLKKVTTKIASEYRKRVSQK